MHSDGEQASTTVSGVKRKRTRKFQIKEFIKQNQYNERPNKKGGNKVVIYDSDEVAEYDPSEVTQDPGTVYNAAS